MYNLLRRFFACPSWIKDIKKYIAKKWQGILIKIVYFHNSENVYVNHGSSFHEVISLTVLIILGY